MFGIHDLWLFVLAGLLLNITPGPDMALVMARSMRDGARAGAVAALGVGAGAFVHIAAAAIGLSLIIAQSALAFAVVKWLGVAYLVVTGLASSSRGHRRWRPPRLRRPPPSAPCSRRGS